MILKIENWNSNKIDNLIIYLETIKDLKYKNFNDKIINTSSKTIGVQIPKLRIIAKEISKGNFISFLEQKIPDIFELQIIYALLLSKIDDNNVAYHYFQNFINCINNWALCDIFCGEYKIVNKNKTFYLDKIKKLAKTNDEFKVRVALILLLKFYINTNLNDIFNIVSSVICDKYYTNMGISWLLSFCYLYDKKSTLNYIKNCNLSKFIINKTYQKITESLKIDKEEKLFIKSLKIK